jgi:hypothetical protein
MVAANSRTSKRLINQTMTLLSYDFDGDMNLHTYRPTSRENNMQQRTFNKELKSPTHVGEFIKFHLKFAIEPTVQNYDCKQLTAEDGAFGGHFPKTRFLQERIRTVENGLR